MGPLATTLYFSTMYPEPEPINPVMEQTTYLLDHKMESHRINILVQFIDVLAVIAAWISVFVKIQHSTS